MELKEYIDIIKRKIWILILVPFLCGITTDIFNCFFSKKTYESKTTLYIGKRSEEQTGIGYNDILMGQYLVKDYREIAKSRSVLEEVVDELIYEGKLDEDFNPSSLSDKISVNLCGDTRVIEIKVQDTDPQTARNLANKVAEVFKEKVKELMEIDNVKIIDKATLPDKNNPTKPKRLRDILIASLFGILLGLGIIFFMEYLDNTIKTSEDAEKYLGLPVIGTIPHMVYEEKNR